MFRLVYCIAISGLILFSTSASDIRHPDVERLFNTSGYIVLGEFVEGYDEETVFHKIKHQAGTEYIKRSYVGKIRVEAILPGFKNLSRERITYSEIPVSFTKSDLEALEKADVFLIDDEIYSLVSPVRPLRENYPHLAQIRDILRSGNYYLRPYKPFIGTWVGQNETGEEVALLTLEEHGFGTMGIHGGQKIRWKPYKDYIGIYPYGGYGIDGSSDEDWVIKMKLVVDDESKTSTISHHGITYRHSGQNKNFSGILERMLKLQKTVEPGLGHPAVGIWRLNIRFGNSEVQDFQFVAFNPDSSIYWFNSDKELRRFGCWKAIAGETQFFVKWEEDRGHLARVIDGNDGEYLMLNHFRGIRMSEEELEAISIPDEAQVP